MYPSAEWMLTNLRLVWTQGLTGLQCTSEEPREAVMTLTQGGGVKIPLNSIWILLVQLWAKLPQQGTLFESPLRSEKSWSS